MYFLPHSVSLVPLIPGECCIFPLNSFSSDKWHEAHSLSTHFDIRTIFRTQLHWLKSYCLYDSREQIYEFRKLRGESSRLTFKRRMHTLVLSSCNNNMKQGNIKTHTATMPNHSLRLFFGTAPSTVKNTA